MDDIGRMLGGGGGDLVGALTGLVGGECAPGDLLGGMMGGRTD